MTIKSDFTAGLEIKTEDIFSPKVPEIGRPELENKREKSNEWKSTILWESTATWAHVFNDAHHVSAMAGYSMKYEKYKWTAITQANSTEKTDIRSRMVRLATGANISLKKKFGKNP